MIAAMAYSFSDLVTDGMDVYDADDQKVGTVADVFDATARDTSNSGGGYLRVPTGFLGLGKEHHIPFSAIRNLVGERIYLSVVKGDLDNLGFAEAPMERTDFSDEPGDGLGDEHLSAPDASSQLPRRADDGRRTLHLRQEQLVVRRQSGLVDESGRRPQRAPEPEPEPEPRGILVPLTRDEVRIERDSADAAPPERPLWSTSVTISVPLREEQVTVQKRMVVYEEIDIGKRAVRTVRRLTDTVRREEVVVEQQGNVEMRDERAPRARGVGSPG